ncbi:hypothetical protein GCM10027360_60450 [Amycolatopsis echigonensis]
MQGVLQRLDEFDQHVQAVADQLADRVEREARHVDGRARDEAGAVLHQLAARHRDVPGVLGRAELVDGTGDRAVALADDWRFFARSDAFWTRLSS